MTELQFFAHYPQPLQTLHMLMVQVSDSNLTEVQEHFSNIHTLFPFVLHAPSFSLCLYHAVYYPFAISFNFVLDFTQKQNVIIIIIIIII